MTESAEVQLDRTQSEQRRVREVEHYLAVLEDNDTNLTSLAALLANLCKVPFSGVSLVDSQHIWIKAHYGIEASCLPREGAFCAKAIDCNEELFAVTNTLEDPCFQHNPLVKNAPNIRFYAAAPFYGNQGFAIGTLWIMDTKPIELTEDMVTILKCLSAYVGQSLGSRYICDVTQLPNKLSFIRRLQGLMNHKSGKVSVGAIHIQRLRHITNIYGSSFRDELVNIISKRFTEWGKSQQLLSHFGNGNFSFACFGEDTRADVANLLSMLSAPVTLSGVTLSVTVNMGVATAYTSEASAAALTDMAELASVEKKRNGLANINFLEGFDANQQLAMDIRACLHRDEIDNYLTPCYQPQVDMSNGNITGFEALLRWHNTRFQNTPVWQVLKVVEDMGMTPVLDILVFQKVCEDIAHWQKQGLKVPKISTNLSRTTVQTAQLVDELKQILKTNGLDEKSVELEITEDGLPLDDKLLSAHISTLRSAGFNIAIDDFGTGMSNIATIVNIDCNLLKVDRQFVHGVSLNNHIAVLLRLIKGTADSMNLPLLVEGVETQDDLDWLGEMGIDLIQGWYFSKALPSHVMPQLLTEMAEGNPGTGRNSKAEYLRCMLARISRGLPLR
ncbi:EAL domain-containing protein [Shewanella sp. GXUN23E]|uniref:sensor domain-containing diguanylate cyclase n=1 Tax=Shewanella sp. GXUN23E TaxID=3422498 RepID=UPI003D7D8ACE